MLYVNQFLKVLQVVNILKYVFNEKATSNLYEVMLFDLKQTI